MADGSLWDTLSSLTGPQGIELLGTALRDLGIGRPQNRVYPFGGLQRLGSGLQARGEQNQRATATQGILKALPDEFRDLAGPLEALAKTGDLNPAALIPLITSVAQRGRAEKASQAYAALPSSAPPQPVELEPLRPAMYDEALSGPEGTTMAPEQPAVTTTVPGRVTSGQLREAIGKVPTDYQDLVRKEAMPEIRRAPEQAADPETVQALRTQYVNFRRRGLSNEDAKLAAERVVLGKETAKTIEGEIEAKTDRMEVAEALDAQGQHALAAAVVNGSKSALEHGRKLVYQAPKEPFEHFDPATGTMTAVPRGIGPTGERTYGAPQTIEGVGTPRAQAPNKDRLRAIAAGDLTPGPGDPKTPDAAAKRLKDIADEAIRVAVAQGRGRQDAAAGSYGPEEIAYEAQQLAANPFRSLRFLPASVRPKVIAEAAKMQRDSGMGPVERKGMIDASRAELTAIQRQRGLIMSFAETADKNLDLAVRLMDQVDNTGVPVLNRWLRAGQRQIKGDAAVNNLDIALKTVSNEYSKVTSSATGAGVGTDRERQAFESLLDRGLTPEMLKGARDVIKIELGNRGSAYEDNINRVRRALRDLTPGQQPAGAPGGRSPADPLGIR